MATVTGPQGPGLVPTTPGGDGEPRANAALRVRLPATARPAPSGPELAAAPLVVRRVEEEETVVTFPTLVWKEFLAGLGCLVLLVAVSVQINAPLLQIANTAITPNPAKAPWYFVGLQELLEHFPPVMAGVMFPTFVIIGMIVTPYLDRNPSRRPQDRKVAIVMFTIYLCLAVTFVLAGQLFRGLGFNWDWTQVLGHPGLQSPY